MTACNHSRWEPSHDYRPLETTAERQAWVADLADSGLFGAKGTKDFARSADWRVEADRILANAGAG